MTISYLSRGQFAKRIGVTDNAMGRYKLPEADAEIAGRRGWLESTIDEWMLNRPGRGARTDLKDEDE